MLKRSMLWRHYYLKSWDNTTLTCCLELSEDISFGEPPTFAECCDMIQPDQRRIIQPLSLFLPTVLHVSYLWSEERKAVKLISNEVHPLKELSGGEMSVWLHSPKTSCYEHSTANMVEEGAFVLYFCGLLIKTHPQCDFRKFSRL